LGDQVVNQNADVALAPVHGVKRKAISYAEISQSRAGGKQERSAMLRSYRICEHFALPPCNSEQLDLVPRRDATFDRKVSHRLAKTFEVLRDLDRRGEKALVFVEHRSMQSCSRSGDDIVQLNVLWFINGATPGSRRQKIVNEFQVAAAGFDMMILLTKSRRVVGLRSQRLTMYTPKSGFLEPCSEDQCNDRVYRIGRTRPVTNHVPIAVHPFTRTIRWT